MRDERRQERHQQISQAAYELLAAHGYVGTSMLRVARAAKASNETLYRWYGDKDGLFLAMVKDNADETKRILEKAILEGEAPMETLARVAPVLLRMVLGDRAVLLNRAAAADPSGRLGAAISAGGRDSVQPLLERVMAGLSRESSRDPAQLSRWFLGVLIGDWQIRRVIGEIPAPDDAAIKLRCEETLSALRILLG